MHGSEPSIVEVLASVTDSAVEDWEELDGPQSRVGVDYWHRNRKTGVEAYSNLDQDHLTICVGGEKVYDGQQAPRALQDNRL